MKRKARASKTEKNAIIADWKTGKHTLTKLSEKYGRHLFTIRRIVGAPGKIRSGGDLATANKALRKVSTMLETDNQFLNKICDELSRIVPEAATVSFDLATRRVAITTIERKEIQL